MTTSRPFYDRQSTTLSPSAATTSSYPHRNSSTYSLPVKSESKSSLLRWLKIFSSSPSTRKLVPPPYQPQGRGLKTTVAGENKVFGVALERSLQYASVAISMVNEQGQPEVYGYIPIVVAKCGMMLKERATATEGIFRVSGSNKRINELQAIFDTGPRFGKDLDWEGYTVHDAASVLRRFLNLMPDPVIPQDVYREFTAVLQKSLPLTASISQYRSLISRLPPTSRYLLLYLLDFLAVFARCSHQNLMNASNLAVVFQPGLVSTRNEADGNLLGFPGFDGASSSPALAGPFSSEGLISHSQAMGRIASAGAGEHARGKQVLEFLIEQQEFFVLGLEGPIPAAIDPYAAGVGQLSSTSAGGANSGGLGKTELSRRGSDKSVERRRLKKIKDGEVAEAGKVKRSKTLPDRKDKSLKLTGSSPASPLIPSTSPLPPMSISIPTSPRSSSDQVSRPRKRDRRPNSPTIPETTVFADFSLPSASPLSPISSPKLGESREKEKWAPWRSKK